MKDRDGAAIARGERQITDALDGRVKKRAMTPSERELIVSRVVGVSDADASWKKHLSAAQLVVEAVPEDLALKHRVLRDIEPLLAPDAVIASNTSALPIASVASAAAHPGRVLGMHYFSPVDKMPLLEIIPHAGTTPDALAAAYDLGLRQGKTVIVVKDVPGFYVNRSLAPWAAEALLLVQQGFAPDALDAAVRKFGYPVGPVTLADEVGIDVLYHTYNTMKGALPADRMAGADPAWLRAIVEAKMLGRKSGRGFYMYPDAGKAKKGGKGGSGGKDKTVNPEAVAIVAPYRTKEAEGLKPEAAVERMVLRFVKECVHSLEDGVIRNAADGDIGAVFGLGFPPFLGGPFRYADIAGPAVIAARMQALADVHGPRFAPPQLLLDVAKSGRKFHPARE
jgi:enoyl-CoA hydratase/long-chain 3-hydroxyacyl-CoA dehydrogenase